MRHIHYILYALLLNLDYYVLHCRVPRVCQWMNWHQDKAARLEAFDVVEWLRGRRS